MHIVADKLTQLNTTKQNIKQAIIDKGVDLTDVPFTNYPAKIAEISGGGTLSFFPPTPTDNKIHLYITVTRTTGLTVDLRYYARYCNVYADWGDGTALELLDGVGSYHMKLSQHTYSTYGDYVIKLSVDKAPGHPTPNFHLGGYDNSTNPYTYYSVIGGTSTAKSGMLTYCCIDPNFEYFTQLLRQSFRYCRSLRVLHIPAAVTSLLEQILYYCYQSVTYVFHGTTPPSIKTNTFSAMSITCRIYVPDESVDDYKNATNWNNYANYIYPMSEMGGDN